MKNESSNDVTLGQMEVLCNEACDLRDKIRLLEAQAAELSKELTAKKSKMILAMEAAGLTRFASGIGRIELVESFSASLPTDPEEKKRIFAEMRANYGDEFMEGKLTLYAKSVESLVKEALEEAAAKGVVLNEFYGLPIKQNRYIKII